MTRILIPRSDNISAKKIEPSDFESYFGCHIPDHIVCGLCVSIGAGLSVCVAAGNAKLNGLLLNNSATCNVASLTNSATNKVYMHVCRDVNCEADEWTFGKTTGAVPACSLHIANAVASGGAITCVSIKTFVADICDTNFVYNMTTAVRTALTWWEANKITHDTCTNLLYYNSHGSAPTSVTWTILAGGAEGKAFSQNGTPATNDVLKYGGTDWEKGTIQKRRGMVFMTYWDDSTQCAGTRQYMGPWGAYTGGTASHYGTNDCTTASNVSMPITAEAITIKRVRFHIRADGVTNGTFDFGVKNETDTLSNIHNWDGTAANATGRYDSGAISVSVDGGDNIVVYYEPNGTTAVAANFVCLIEFEYDNIF